MTKDIDIDAALRDPSAVFASPEDVRDRSTLTTAQKVEILRRWEYDESELAVATEEGMPDGRAPMLRRILAALHALGASVDTEHSPPTKQSGI